MSTLIILIMSIISSLSLTLAPIPTTQAHTEPASCSTHLCLSNESELYEKAFSTLDDSGVVQILDAGEGVELTLMGYINAPTYAKRTGYAKTTVTDEDGVTYVFSVTYPNSYTLTA